MNNNLIYLFHAQMWFQYHCSFVWFMYDVSDENDYVTHSGCFVNIHPQPFDAISYFIDPEWGLRLFTSQHVQKIICLKSVFQKRTDDGI